MPAVLVIADVQATKRLRRLSREITGSLATPSGIAPAGVRPSSRCFALRSRALA